MNYALIGYPLGHSMSPFIHKNLFSLAKAEGNYNLLEIPSERLRREEFSGFDGFNVTIPYKIDVISLLDSLEGIAKQINSVNTVTRVGEKLVGYNTDYDGMLYSLKSANIELKGKIVLCGAGGVARMMAHAVAISGSELTIIARNEAKAKSLADEIERTYNVSVSLADSGENYDLLLNGTPAGMYPNVDTLPTNESLISRCESIFDAVYNPKDTKLISLAKSNGSKIAYGMPMLVYQAAAAQKIWYNAQFSDEDIANLCEQTQIELERKF